MTENGRDYCQAYFCMGVEECVSVKRGFIGKFVFLYVYMHVLIYEGRNATSSTTLINVFTFIFVSLKSDIIKICQRNHFGKQVLQYLVKNNNGLSLLAVIPHFRALFFSF